MSPDPRIRAQERTAPNTQKIRHWRDGSIDELEVAPRLHGILRRHGFSLVAEVDDLSDAELLRVSMLGRNYLKEVRAAVNRFRQKYHTYGCGSPDDWSSR